MTTFKKLNFFCIIFCILIFYYVYNNSIKNPENLSNPFNILNINVLADGGSMSLQLVDTKGVRFGVMRTVDLKNKTQELFIINYLGGEVPIKRLVVKNSELEKQIIKMLHSIVDNSMSPEDLKAINDYDQLKINNIDIRLLGAYEFLHWLESRQ